MPTNRLGVVITADASKAIKAIREVKRDIEALQEKMYRDRFGVFWRIARWYFRRKNRRQFTRFAKSYEKFNRFYRGGER